MKLTRCSESWGSTLKSRNLEIKLVFLSIANSSCVFNAVKESFCRAHPEWRRPQLQIASALSFVPLSPAHHPSVRTKPGCIAPGCQMPLENLRRKSNHFDIYNSSYITTCGLPVIEPARFQASTTEPKRCQRFQLLVHR